MNANGTGVHRVIDRVPIPEEPGEELVGAFNPAFSPSGGRIVFTAGEDVWSVGPAGGNLQRVAEDGDETDWARAAG
jgi:hypothetical protein